MAQGYPGTYAGIVVDTADPEQQHRLLVTIPAVYESTSTWARPSYTPDGDDDVVLPSLGDQVSISFEHGDSDYPIWTEGAADTTPATHGWIGIYRGEVVNDVDPLESHRVQVILPEVGVDTAWATPADELGTDIVSPSVGTAVWIRFADGNVDYPVWVGLR